MMIKSYIFDTSNAFLSIYSLFSLSTNSISIATGQYAMGLYQH
jgi:hypothetical protein